jgi:hypothetical protein
MMIVGDTVEGLGVGRRAGGVGRQGSETAGTGRENRGTGNPGNEKGTERYVHRGGLPTWGGKLLGTYLSVPFRPLRQGSFHPVSRADRPYSELRASPAGRAATLDVAFSGVVLKYHRSN